MSDNPTANQFDTDDDDDSGSLQPGQGFDTMATDDEVDEVERKLRNELDKASPAPELGEFYQNLAETLDAGELRALGLRYFDLYEVDKDTRQKRDQNQRDAIEGMGLQGNEPGGPSEADGLEGGSIVTHPGFLKAAVQYTSQIVTELLPPDGPVRTHVVGDVTGEKLEKAERKARHMNWQLTKQAPEFFDEFEKTQSQVPVGGCQFMFAWFDAVERRPRFQFTPTERVFVPYETTWFYGARRITVEMVTTRADIEAKIAAGVYLEDDLIRASVMPEPTQSEQAINRTTGRNDPVTNPDDVQTILWMSVVDDLVGEGVNPYIMEIDQETHNVRCIYRNWKENDDKHRRLNWLIKFPFLAWRDAYDLSLYAVLSSLSVSATGALRALLDSALVNTTPTLLALEGANISGQNQNIALTQVNKLEGGLNVDDIRKVAMPVPFNQPSPALFQLLGFLSEQAEQMVRITLDDSAVDSNANTPVGTQLSRVEQGLKVFKAIHARNHRALATLLETLHNINELYLDEQDLVIETGERLAYRSDYEGPLDVAPVSDPAIFSEQQRFAQVQAVAQRAQQSLMNPVTVGLYNQRNVEEYVLKTLKVPNYDELLQKPQEAEFQNAVNENMMLVLQRPVMAFPDQDHLAHLQTHLAFMMDPTFGANPAIQSGLLPGMLKHLIEHLAMWYVSNTYDEVTTAAGQPAERLIDTKSPTLLRRFDRMLATAQPIVLQKAKMTLGQIPMIVQQASQMVQQMQQSQMQMMAQMQGGPAAMAAMQRNQIDQQLGTQRLQLEAQKQQQAAQKDQGELQLDQQRNQGELQVKLGLNQLKGAELQQAASLEHAQLFQNATRDQADVDTQRRELAANALLQANEARASEDQSRLEGALDARQQSADRDLQYAQLHQQNELNARDNDVRLEIARMSAWERERQAKQKGPSE